MSWAQNRTSVGLTDVKLHGEKLLRQFCERRLTILKVASILGILLSKSVILRKIAAILEFILSKSAILLSILKLNTQFPV